MFAIFDDDVLLISHVDPNQALSSCSPHPIELDGAEWPSVEHYVIAMRFEDPQWREKIRQASHPRLVRKMAKTLFKRKKPNWKTERQVYMTRGMYIKCKTWPLVAKELLETADRQIVDTTEYDYFWGIGRDTRGENRFGKVLEDVRRKLKEETSNEGSV